MVSELFNLLKEYKNSVINQFRLDQNSREYGYTKDMINIYIAGIDLLFKRRVGSLYLLKNSKNSLEEGTKQCRDSKTELDYIIKENKDYLEIRLDLTSHEMLYLSCANDFIYLLGDLEKICIFKNENGIFSIDELDFMGKITTRLYDASASRYIIRYLSQCYSWEEFLKGFNQLGLTPDISITTRDFIFEGSKLYEQTIEVPAYYLNNRVDKIAVDWHKDNIVEKHLEKIDTLTSEIKLQTFDEFYSVLKRNKIRK